MSREDNECSRGAYQSLLSLEIATLKRHSVETVGRRKEAVTASVLNAVR